MIGQVRARANEVMAAFGQRKDEMIEKAMFYGQEPYAGRCKEGKHTKNCGNGLDGTDLLEYYWYRSEGQIPEMAEEEWGCEWETRKKQQAEWEDGKVAMAFRDIDWNGGFTGRGSTPSSKPHYQSTC